MGCYSECRSNTPTWAAKHPTIRAEQDTNERERNTTGKHIYMLINAFIWTFSVNCQKIVIFSFLFSEKLDNNYNISVYTRAIHKKCTLSALTLPPTRTVFSTHPLSFIRVLRTHTHIHTYLYDDNGSLITINPTQHKQYHFLLWPRSLCIVIGSLQCFTAFKLPTFSLHCMCFLYCIVAE